MDMMKRILPAPVDGGFGMTDYWVWCGSVIKGEDGKYHMFAARWPRELPFFQGYLSHSEIVRAVADSPEGHYEFVDVVLPARGPEYWDGRMTHNPTIQKYGDKYYLFYIGSTFKQEPPTAEDYEKAPDPPVREESYSNIRIGVAMASNIEGPWERLDHPILEPRPGKWDESIVTNPAPCFDSEGRVLLIYRSNPPGGLRLGATMAEKPEGPYERLKDDPIFDVNVEDPFIWHSKEGFEMLAKDMTGEITGEKHAGVHAISKDGVDWHLAEPAKAYSRHVDWNDGKGTDQGSLERPQLLLEDGVPCYLFAATADGPGGFRQASRTWNMVIPLQHQYEQDEDNPVPGFVN